MHRGGVAGACVTCVCCGNGGCGGLFGVVKCDVDCVVERGRHRGFCGWVLRLWLLVVGKRWWWVSLVGVV